MATGYGPEEDVAHWADANVVADLIHAGRKFVVRRLPDEAERKYASTFARCEISLNGKPVGSFGLSERDGQRAMWGHLQRSHADKGTTTYDAFIFDVFEVASTDDWENLLEFAKKAIDYDYNFPASLKIRKSSFDVPTPKGHKTE